MRWPAAVWRRLVVAALLVLAVLRGAYGRSPADACLAEVADYLRLTSSLAPPPCRNDFAAMAQRHFFRTGHAAEIGVYRGRFAEHNAQVWQGHYYAIDAWAYRPGDPGDKNFKSYATNKDSMSTTRKRLHDATGGNTSRYTVMQALSTEAAEKFPDDHFDWLYIDALHTHDAVVKDMRAWWPKLRTGGLMSGDDYGDVNDTEYLTRARYPRTVIKKEAGLMPYMPTNRWGVISAVQEVARSFNSPLHVTWSLDCYKWPAWWIVKSPRCAGL